MKNKEKIRNQVKEIIPDLVSSLMYCDRKEDEDLSVQDIEFVMDCKLAEEIGDIFKEELRKIAK